ncbi:MAG TPA: bifunctional adenosylcobinamide kinase/adenosylcobinamide-phosphate guanylyltransferase [Acidimicrobiales bacterium]|nr:bifunctional adenosylcobinamide kinase/adenosylcobinamide-phosphate guanylyltransferase [Acidimicrobiales bacterium]
MITLVLGGARSGKSEFAERLARSGGGAVTYVATATVTGDPDFEARIRRHRDRRPPDWRTAEPGRDLVAFVRSDRTGSTLLVDSLGTWVASFDRFETDIDGLCRALADRPGRAIVVSEEVGLGVHPSTELGGRFRDALGAVNQAVAEIADQAYLVVAGRPLTLESGI